MKLAVALLIALTAPLYAALLADVQTTAGNIQVELEYTQAPQAVANFITLANRTRAHIDPATGALSYQPFYIGEKFFRVVNQPSFKIVQTGSGTGTNSGGPGYTFKDEFTPDLRHVPYVLSMANSGPNSNGSQIFFTGDVSIPHLNDVHTIFGSIIDPASRAAIDAILAAGDNGVTITDITFSRTDPEAVAFDEFAQGLPTVTQPRGKLSVVRNVAAKWTLDEPLATGDVFQAFRSTTLAPGSWNELTAAEVQWGIRPVGEIHAPSPLTLGQATSEKEFYNLTFTHHPGSVTPTLLHTRKLVISYTGGRIEYQFNITGSGGSGVYIPDVGDPLTFTTNVMNVETAGHAFTAVVENVGINPRYLRMNIGWDSATDTQIDGRHVTSYYSFGQWPHFQSGPASISR